MSRGPGQSTETTQARAARAARARHGPPEAERASATVGLRVVEADTAAALQTGDVPVLATPRLVTLAEEASCRALAGRLPPGRTTVASRVQFDHLVPVPVGASVVAEAALEKVEGRRFIFTLTVVRDDSECAGPVAVGRLTRVLVDREAFLAKAGALSPGSGEERADPGGG